MTKLETYDEDVEETFEEKPVSTLFGHCVTVYDEMKRQARMEDVNEVPTLVYEGHLTRLVLQGVNLSAPYYTSVLKALKAMGCVYQLKRGGGGATSKWSLLQAPTEDDFRNMKTMNKPLSGKLAQLEQQMRDMNRRLLEAETRLNLLDGRQ